MQSNEKPATGHRSRAQGSGPNGSSPATLYTGKRLIVGDGERVIDSFALVVRDGRVEQIGPHDSIEADPSWRTVPLTGKTVLPAIVNPHGHIGYMRGTVSDAANYSRENVLDHLRRFAYYGVSTFQSLGTDRDDTEIRIRDEQRAGALSDQDMATLFTAGAGIVAPTPGSTNGGPAFAADILFEATDAEGAREYVRHLAAQRVDAVKFWVDDRNGTKAKLPHDVYAAIIDEAHAHGIKAAAHIYTREDAKRVIRAGVDILAHMPRDPGPDDELLQLLTAHDVVAFSSMSIQRPDGEAWLNDPAVTESVLPADIEDLRLRIREVAPQPLFDTKETYACMEDTLKAYLRAGVRLVFSADTGLLAQLPGLAEHRELQALVDAGMPALDAIEAATRRSARMLGLHDRGTLEVGMRADMLVLDEDPLDDIRNSRRIHAVYLGGQELDRAALATSFLRRDA